MNGPTYLFDNNLAQKIIDCKNKRESKSLIREIRHFFDTNVMANYQQGKLDGRAELISEFKMLINLDDN